jgi:hypothetical protein
MKVVRHTLVSEGSTDANLIPIIDWTLKNTAGVPLSQGERAEFWRLPKKPGNLSERLLEATKLFPCEILFVHRDADAELPQARMDEIRQAFEQASIQLPAVAIIPVRMLEAWLCFNEDAIRKASGNPNGKVPLNLPRLQRVESRPDPKRDLNEALLTASERLGRRRKKFDTAKAFWRIVDCIEDFSPLRELPSFQAFERSVKSLKDNDLRPGFYG